MVGLRGQIWATAKVFADVQYQVASSHQRLKRKALLALLQKMHLLYDIDERCLFTDRHKKTD